MSVTTLAQAETVLELNPPLVDTGLPSALAYLGRTLSFLHLPGTAEYDAAVSPWNVARSPRPVAVVEARRAGDVADALRFARRHRLQVAVQATGHGIASDLEGVLLVSTRRLTGLVVDAERRTARAEAGVRWTQVLKEAGAHGLAGLCGSSPGVGVVGYTTGGGVGPLVRTHGLAADRVRAFDVVTGDGEIRRASATENPELFWALRGGKGLLGIVTAVELDLLPLPQIYAGAVFFDAADAPTVLRHWARWCPTLPRQATTSVAVLRLPAMPGVPEPLAGKVTVAVRFAWSGEEQAGSAVLDELRAVATPVLDGVSTMPYAALGAIHADPVDPMPVHEAHALLGAVDDRTVQALLARVGAEAACPQIMVELRQLGGAVEDCGGVPSAFDQRGAAYSLMAIGPAVPPVLDAVTEHASDLVAALEPWTVPGRLPNFAPLTGADGLAATYRPETLSRLARASEAYDPDTTLLGSDWLPRRPAGGSRLRAAVLAALGR